jgi:hypothetical protein
MAPLVLYPLGKETGWGTLGFDESDVDCGGQHSVSGSVRQYATQLDSRHILADMVDSC